MAREKVTRIAAMIEGAAAGMRILRISASLPAPRTRATSTSPRSTERTPATVFMNTMKNTISAASRIFGVSASPTT